MNSDEVRTLIDNPDTWPEPLDPEPGYETLKSWVYDSVVEATDGCRIEPDGACEHGHVSWLLYLEII